MTDTEPFPALPAHPPRREGNDSDSSDDLDWPLRIIPNPNPPLRAVNADETGSPSSSRPPSPSTSAPELHHTVDTFPGIRNHVFTFPPLSPAPKLFTRLNLRRRVFFHTLSLPPPPSIPFPQKLRRPPTPRPSGPTFTKTYAARPNLPVRIYIPPPTASQPGRLPLYVHIAPTEFLRSNSSIRGKEEQATERFCARLAHGHGICVANVTFRRPPRWLFPTQIYDVVAIVQEILGGTALPIDRRRVAIGGFGAGANVALGVVQTGELRGIIGGVLAICPVADWTIPVAEKLASVETGKEIVAVEEDKKKRNKEGQRIERLHQLIDYAYVPPRQDLSDPLLSPGYANRGIIPRQVLIVGAQLDMLCTEAEKMALRWAVEEHGETVGNEDAWTKGGIKWEKVFGWGHEFAFHEEKGHRELERQSVLDDLFDRVGDWLWAKVYP